MRAAIMSIGSELIEGYITDTNATFLAQEMKQLGIELIDVFQVGDHLERIVATMRRAWDDAELLVTTGGIGPTDDDLTREGVAALLSETVEVDPVLLETVRRFFAARGVSMPEQNAKQAWLIPSASPLTNPMGTAPGWYVQRDGHVIVSMPGVPREMARMWHEQVVPRLLPMLGDRALASTTLKTIGIGESAAERLIADIIHRGDPIVATYAKDDGVHVRITTSAATQAAADEAVRRTEFEVRDVLQAYIYGANEVSLADALLAPLVETGRTLAVSEAGAGGRISGLLAEDQAALVAFHGGLVRAFEHVASEHQIDPLAPDAPAQVAAAAATACRLAQQADLGMAVAVRLRPGEVPDRTEGDVAIHITDGVGERRHSQQLRTLPSEIRRRAALAAAEALRYALLNGLPHPE